MEQSPAGQMELKLQKKKFAFTQVQLACGVLGIAGLAFFGGITARGVVPFASAAPIYDVRQPEVNIEPLFTAWHLLDDNFAPATTTATTSAQDKLYGAIKGLASSYGDDYTVFFPPVQKKIFETQVDGGFEGVGMEIGSRNGILTVVAPIKGTPADKAGIKSGDLILEINGKSTNGVPVDQAVNSIRGKKGTQVVLTIAREGKDDGKPFKVSVTRDTIELPTVDAALRDDGVYVIKVYTFNQNAPRLFADAIDKFKNSHSDKLIIDLRNNPGGYLEAAVDMASWFLPSGDTVVIQDNGKKKPEQVYRSSGFGALGAVKIAVLMDGGSASASEIFAGALHDHDRATLIGRQSFGKGSVQQVFDVTADTSLKITIARWLTPNRISISHQGLTPDIAVTIPEGGVTEGTDPDVARAVEFLTTGK